MLPPDEVIARARRVRLVLTDCDGVLTDNGVYYSARGEELKRFSIRDGMGVERLRNAGIAAAIITGENAEMVLRRAEKLKMRAHLGIKDKASYLASALEDGMTLEHVAYIGDDVNDLEVMAKLDAHGLTASPADAMPEVRSRTHYVTKAPGGHGAFRDFVEWILAARA